MKQLPASGLTTSSRSSRMFSGYSATLTSWRKVNWSLDSKCCSSPPVALTFAVNWWCTEMGWPLWVNTETKVKQKHINLVSVQKRILLLDKQLKVVWCNMKREKPSQYHFLTQSLSWYNQPRLVPSGSGWSLFVVLLLISKSFLIFSSLRKRGVEATCYTSRQFGEEQGEKEGGREVTGVLRPQHQNIKLNYARCVICF